VNALPAATDPTFYQALRSRDRRFDGAFFVGVTSTGIYCRPVCPSRTPLARNCRFFPLAALAQEAGFRPCLRCRPELAPAAHRSSSDSVTSRLVRLLREAALEGGRLEDVARPSGWSVRQLRRKVMDECGLTPSAIMQTERLLFAKRLLHETGLPMGEVALRAGFRSVRRFNAVFAEKCGMRPSAIRSNHESKVSDGVIRLRLDYRGPYAWSEMLEWLRNRATRGVEVVTGEAWIRTVRLDGHDGWLRVTQDQERDALLVEITPGLTPVLPQIVRRLRGLFDLDANPAEMAPVFFSPFTTLEDAALSLTALPGIGPWTAEYIAMRALRYPDAFPAGDIALRKALSDGVAVSIASAEAASHAWRPWRAYAAALLWQSLKT